MMYKVDGGQSFARLVLGRVFSLVEGPGAALVVYSKDQIVVISLRQGFIPGPWVPDLLTLVLMLQQVSVSCQMLRLPFYLSVLLCMLKQAIIYQYK